MRVLESPGDDWNKKEGKKLLVIDLDSLRSPPLKWGPYGLPFFVPTSIFGMMPYTNCPEETIAWLATRPTSGKAYSVYREILQHLKKFPHNKKLDDKMRQFRAHKSISRSAARRPLPGRTLVPFQRGAKQPDNTPADSQQTSYIRVAKAKEIINTPSGKKCQEMDDAATEMLRKAGFFD